MKEIYESIVEAYEAKGTKMELATKSEMIYLLSMIGVNGHPYYEMLGNKTPQQLTTVSPIEVITLPQTGQT